MFMSQRRRAIQLPRNHKNNDHQSGTSSSAEQESGQVGVTGTADKHFGIDAQFRGKLSQALVDFKAQSRLDRKLLLGVLEKPKKKQNNQKLKELKRGSKHRTGGSSTGIGQNRVDPVRVVELNEPYPY